MYKKALLASLVVGATIGIIVGVAKNKMIEERKIKKEIKDLEQTNTELDKLINEINETEKLIWLETNHKRVQKGLKPILKLV